MCARDRTNSKHHIALPERNETQPAVTCATPCPVVEYIAQVRAVYAATVPVNEYATGMVCGQNAMPFIRTWVSSRNSASLCQRPMSNANFVVRPKMAGLNKAPSFLSGRESLIEQKSSKKFLHRHSVA